MATTWVYGFDRLDDVEGLVGGGWDDVRALLGGKGANLAAMTRLGIAVPPGFTITTQACLRWIADDGTPPEGMWDQVAAALRAVEDGTGRRFGDPSNPLLLSCRSGARFSMPGMMDTVLDIGLNDDTAKGMIALTGDEKAVLDSYRRLVQMFGTVVLGLRDEPFEHVLADAREARGVDSDADLTAEDLRGVVEAFRGLAVRFPTDPVAQLRMAVEAVFASWDGRRAVDYRNAAGIPHDLGTAVNVQAMVFGNLGTTSATGVAMTRSGKTGEPGLEGDWLVGAQGEDVVAGTRATRPIEALAEELPDLHAQLTAAAQRLESHYRDMQDIEFTIEDGRLWLLQTRDGKRTAQAAVRIAVDLAREGVITTDEALRRVTPEQVDVFLHPQLEPSARDMAREDGRMVATGLDVSPGAAVGVVAFDPDVAEAMAARGRDVILVRPETKPDDVHGMLAAKGILTARGGRTSHAALVARQFGTPAVVGVASLDIDLVGNVATVAGHEVREGDWVSLDGSTGEVFLAHLDTVVPEVDDPWLAQLLQWADQRRVLGVRGNADDPADAALARTLGAEGIGLCRTEHMFFAPDRLPVVQRMIMASAADERREALAELEPLQRGDFLGLLRAMDGLPVIIRLLDPPLHEFLPTHDELVERITDAKLRLTSAGTLRAVDDLLAQLREDTDTDRRVTALREANPMLGLRGVRLGIVHPEILQMQARAIAEATCAALAEGLDPRPEIMIPLTSASDELALARELVTREVAAVAAEREVELAIRLGTMVETPRAALVAGELAVHAEFFSFGTNDLTQMTFGISRDDAETGFLLRYLEQGLLSANPFAHLDPDGVGRLVALAAEAGRAVRHDLDLGVCGEHGGDPASIALCHEIGLTYVSCSPYRVPVARLAAAHAALADPREGAGRT